MKIPKKFIYNLMLCFALTVPCAVFAGANDKKENANLPTKYDLLKAHPLDKVMGDKKAKMILIEYSSIACPHCADFHINVLPKIKESYIDKGDVLYIHRNFPTNKPSMTASMLALCSDNYFAFLHGLFLSQETWAYDKDPTATLFNIAKLSGMEKKEFDSCINDNALKSRIYSSAFAASKVLQINATPVFFLNGDRIDGSMAYEIMASKIEARLKLYRAADNKAS